MNDDVVIATFPGDPAVLEPRYREAIRRFSAAHPETRPRTFLLSRDAGGLTAVLAWPAPPGHEPFGLYMHSVIAELGIPFPQVRHLELAVSGWEEAAAQPAR
jgi:hypothetical protein